MTTAKSQRSTYAVWNANRTADATNTPVRRLIWIKQYFNSYKKHSRFCLTLVLFLAWTDIQTQVINYTFSQGYIKLDQTYVHTYTVYKAYFKNNPDSHGFLLNYLDSVWPSLICTENTSLINANIHINTSAEQEHTLVIGSERYQTR